MKIKGTDNVKLKLDRLIESSKNNMTDTIVYAAEQTALNAAELCRSDDVKKSLETERQGENRVAVSARHKQAVFEEFGSEVLSPSPFMTPALLQSTDEIRRYMEEKFKE